VLTRSMTTHDRGRTARAYFGRIPGPEPGPARAISHRSASAIPVAHGERGRALPSPLSKTTDAAPLTDHAFNSPGASVPRVGGVPRVHVDNN
jgi:hypothetical protein